MNQNHRHRKIIDCRQFKTNFRFFTSNAHLFLCIIDAIMDRKTFHEGKKRMTSLTSAIIGGLPVDSGFGGLSIGFFLVLGAVALVIILGLVLTAYRNLPHWIFNSWIHVTGIAVGVYLYFAGFGWIAAVAVAGGGLALSGIWITVIERQTEKNRGVLGKINKRLLRHALK